MLRFKDLPYSGLSDLIVTKAYCGGFSAGEVLVSRYKGIISYSVQYKLLGRRDRHSGGLDFKTEEDAMQAGKKRMIELHKDCLEKAGLQEATS